MSRISACFLLFSILCGGYFKPSEGSIVACYYTSWSVGRPGNGQFGVADLPTDLCTHIIYTFYGLTADGAITESVDSTHVSEAKTSRVSDFLALKKSNPDLKLLVSIGGWSGSTNFTTVVNNDTARANFVSNAKVLLDSTDFDGLDIAWDYPGLRGGATTDKAQFVTLLKEMKEAFAGEYLLTAAVAVTQYYIDAGYDVSGMSANLDYIFVQAYEYHGSWEGETGANAPTYAQTTDSETTNLNVNRSIHIWLDNGAPAEKLVLGFPAFGKSFTLSGTNNTNTGAPISGAGNAGPYLEEAGAVSYLEICEYQKNETGWTVVEVPNNYVYAYKDLQWISYDNGNTVYAKGQLAKLNGLAGIGVWSVDEDDFAGKCGEPYPLLTQAKSGFNSKCN